MARFGPSGAGARAAGIEEIPSEDLQAAAEALGVGVELTSGRPRAQGLLRGIRLRVEGELFSRSLAALGGRRKPS